MLSGARTVRSQKTDQRKTKAEANSCCPYFPCRPQGQNKRGSGILTGLYFSESI